MGKLGNGCIVDLRVHAFELRMFNHQRFKRRIAGSFADAENGGVCHAQP